MEIPQNLGSLNDLKRREKKAFDEMSKWEDILDDTYEYFLPNRNLFNREDKGQKKMERIFDSTALESIQQGASKLQEYIAPIWSRWANFEPSKKLLEVLEEQQDLGVSETDLRKGLEEQAETVFDVINRSNFGTQFYEMALDLLIGTGSIMVDEVDDEDMPIVFNSIPQIGVAFEEGPTGSIETHWRRLKVKGRNIERKWIGFKVSEELAQIIKESPDADVDCREGVIYDPKTKTYTGVVWVKDENRASWVEDFGESSPWVTGRYAKASGEVRGRGPAVQVLPDVRSLNKAKEFVLRKAAIDLAGIWTATDDGVTNPYTLTIAPGIVIPVGSNNSQSPSLQRLDTTNDLNLAQFEIVELQNAIRKALFNDIREPDDSVVSATQFAIEAQELAKRIGSAYGRLQSEVLIPILKRVVAILTRRGVIEDIKVGDIDVSIKFTSPLARAQDAEDLLSVQQAVEFTMNTAGPDRIMMSYKLEDFGKWAAKKTGMPQELVRTDAEKEEVIKAGAQAAQQGLPVEQQGGQIGQQ